MATTTYVRDLGAFSYGEHAIFTLTFLRDGTAQNPSVGPFCNLTPPGGVSADYSAQITANGSGVYSFIPVTTVSGTWTGRIYATGQGQTSRDVLYEVAPTANP